MRWFDRASDPHVVGGNGGAGGHGGNGGNANGRIVGACVLNW